MEPCLPAFPGLDGILKAGIAAQVVPLPLEADGGPPALLGPPPVHPGDAAGVVFPHGFGPEHFHAGAVDVGQGHEASPRDPTAAAGGVAVAQAVGLDVRLVSAVAAAVPGGALADVFRWGQDGQRTVALAREVQLFPRVAHLLSPHLFGKLL